MPSYSKEHVPIADPQNIVRVECQTCGSPRVTEIDPEQDATICGGDPQQYYYLYKCCDCGSSSKELTDFVVVNMTIR